MSEDAGRLVGKRYRLGGVLGRGGMGTVWRAEDEILGRTVAVKELRFPASVDEDEKQRLITRTLREAKAIARIRSGSAVTVFDVVQEDDRPWIVMELVEGRSLADHIKLDGPLEPQRAAEVGLAILDVLRAAHREGILHRDVKPSNVLLEDGTGRVVLTDFGIAKVEGDPSVTSTGMLVGAPSYISPERARGKPPGPPADLWSLGGLLFAAVEGSPPYDKGSAISTLTAVMTEPVPEPERAGGLREVIFGLLAKDPAQRLDIAAAQALLRPVAAGEKPGDGDGATAAAPDATRAMPVPAEPEAAEEDPKGAAGAGPSLRKKAAGAVAAGSAAVGAKKPQGAKGGKGTKGGKGAKGGNGAGTGAGSGSGAGAAGKSAGQGTAAAVSGEKAGRQQSSESAGAGAGPASGKSLPAESPSGAGRKAEQRSGAGAATGGAASVGAASVSAASASAAGAAGTGSGSGSASASASESGTGSGPGGGAFGALGGALGGQVQALKERFSRRSLAIAAAVAAAVVVLVGAVALSTADGEEKNGTAQQETGGGGAADKSGEGKDGSGDKGGGKESGSGGSSDPSPKDDKDDKGGAGKDGDGKGEDKPAEPKLPDGYEKVVDDRFHFGMAMPGGFEQTGIAGQNSGVRYADPDQSLPKLQVDFNASPLDDAASAWRSLEPAVQGNSSGYRMLSLKKVDWRGYPTVADWQFLREENGKKVRVLNRGFKVDGSHGYAIMITCVADKWDDAKCKTLRETAFRTFKPAS